MSLPSIALKRPGLPSHEDDDDDNVDDNEDDDDGNGDEDDDEDDEIGKIGVLDKHRPKATRLAKS